MPFQKLDYGPPHDSNLVGYQLIQGRGNDNINPSAAPDACSRRPQVSGIVGQ